LGVVALFLALQADIEQAAADNGFIYRAQARTASKTWQRWDGKRWQRYW